MGRFILGTVFDNLYGVRDVAPALYRSALAPSAFHAARSGSALAVLNQLILLAQLARERGDEAGARLRGSEVGRWAEGLEATRLHSQAAAFAAGADPTRDDG